MVKYTVILITLGFIITSCAPSRLGWTPEDVYGEKETTVFQEDFDPLSLDDDDIKVQSAKKSDTGSDVEPVATVDPERIEQPKKLVSGFRVQILATKDENMAREKKRKAMLVFSEKVYLEYEAPYYKLRLGDFADRKEAETFRDHVSRKGLHEKEDEWRNAWIVPAKVLVTTGTE